MATEIDTGTVVIRIEGQTDQAVKATDKLTAAQKRLQTQAAATGTSLSSAAQAAAAMPAAASPSMLAKVSEGLKGLGVDAKTFSNGLKDIGKGLTFDLVRQGLKALNGDLNSTAKYALSAGVNGAAMGAAFAGPLGAAVGGLAGSVKGLVSSLLDSQEAMRKAREQIELEGKAYWDAIHAAEQKKRIQDLLADSTSRLTREQREQNEREDTHTAIMTATATAMRQASDAALAYADQLAGVNAQIVERLRLEGNLPKTDQYASNAYGTQQDTDTATAIRAARGLRDANLAYYASTVSYGKVLLELQSAENARADRMADLEQIMGDVNVKQDVQNKAIKEYNALAKEALKVDSERAKKARELFAANMKAWGPILNRLTMDERGVKGDPWRSARVAEAEASARADAELAAEDAARQRDASQTVGMYDLRDAVSGIDIAKLQQEFNQGVGDYRKSRIESMFGSLDEINGYKTAFEGLTGAVTAGMQAWISGSESAGTAVRKFLGDYLSGVASQMAIEALKEGAAAIASIAWYDYTGAAMHAKAAAAYVAGAAAAAVAARALGGGGSGGGASSSAGGGGSGGGGVSLAAQREQQREAMAGRQTNVTIVMGDASDDSTPRMRRLKADRLWERARGTTGTVEE